MDEKDEEILHTLMRNSRTPLTRIALKLGITETAVRKRIKKLEERGIIKSYTAIIDPFFMGYSGVALVGLDTTPERLLPVLEYISNLPDVRYASLTTGDHMIMFEAWCKTPENLNALIKKLGGKEGVLRICPAILLKRTE
ncbi:Lrp/AsnC family transcriptional regulator [Candidatus Micrarchaeota archaeon]|nr:Lrp/AsnC family transcriptional regulator [Candidatus Micrarchaeota archaeon]